MAVESIVELRTLVAIVDSGSLARAAVLLNVTPNAVSRRLAMLEERLGRRLVHRTTRHLSVTEDGQRFLSRCRHILDELEEAERELAGSGAVRGTVAVGLHTDMVGPTLMHALRRGLEEHPQLRVRLRLSTTFLDPIRSGLDVAVHIGQPPDSSLVARPLGLLVWCLAAAPGYVEQRGMPGTPGELVEHECLRLRRDGPETHWKLRRGRGQYRRFAVGGRFETTDGYTLRAALYAGLGIGVRLRSEVEVGIRGGTLTRVLPDWQWASTPLFAMLPRGHSKSAGVRVLLDVLRTTTTELSS